MSQIQAAVIVAGDLLVLKIQCVEPALLFATGAITSLVFSLLIYSLTVSFGDVGKAIVVVIMVLQIAGSSGTFPIELLPDVYQKIYHIFPFPYAIDAVRECVCGLYGLTWLKNIGCLLIFGAAALVIGLLGAQALYGTEPFHGGEAERNGNAVRKEDFPMDEKKYSQLYQALLQEVLQFHSGNQRRIRKGMLSLLLVPLAFLVLLFLSDGSRVIFLLLWIVSMFGIAAYLIAVEYIDYEMQNKVKQNHQKRGGAGPADGRCPPACPSCCPICGAGVRRAKRSRRSLPQRSLPQRSLPRRSLPRRSLVPPLSRLVPSLSRPVPPLSRYSRSPCTRSWP